MGRFFLWILGGIVICTHPGTSSPLNDQEPALSPILCKNVFRHFNLSPSPHLNDPEPVFSHACFNADLVAQQEDEVLYFDDEYNVLNDPKKQFLNDFCAMGEALYDLPAVRQSKSPHTIHMPFWGDFANICIRKMPLDNDKKANFYLKIARQKETTYAWFLQFLHYAAHHLLTPIQDFDEVKGIPQEPGKNVFQWDAFWAPKKNVQDNLSNLIAPLFPWITVLPCPYDLTLDDLIQTMPNLDRLDNRTWLIGWMDDSKCPPSDFFYYWRCGLGRLRQLFSDDILSLNDQITFFKNVTFMQYIEDYYMDHPHLLNDTQAHLIQLFFMDFMRLSHRGMKDRVIFLKKQNPIDNAWFEEHESFLTNLGFRPTRACFLYLNDFYSRLQRIMIELKFRPPTVDADVIFRHLRLP